MFVCCKKESSVINSIYSGQHLLSFIKHSCKLQAEKFYEFGTRLKNADEIANHYDLAFSEASFDL
jgi:hypothetical protein